MHDCQKFREDWASGGIAGSRTGCEACDRFCEEAAAVLQYLRTAESFPAEASQEYWDRFDGQLRARLAGVRPMPSWQARWTLGVAAAALILVGAWIGLRTAPANVTAQAVPDGRIEFVDDHIRGLDPAVVDFLAQSELFLRSFTKIQPADADDIDDARAHARRDLAEITQQKTAAGDFSPVRIALDDYEGVLREIKNLHSGNDLKDIQNRIQRNGLIASLKAYQPRAVLVSQR